jgi:hypothetical protein
MTLVRVLGGHEAIEVHCAATFGIGAPGAGADHTDDLVLDGPAAASIADRLGDRASKELRIELPTVGVTFSGCHIFMLGAAPAIDYSRRHGFPPPQGLKETTLRFSGPPPRDNYLALEVSVEERSGSLFDPSGFELDAALTAAPGGWALARFDLCFDGFILCDCKARPSVLAGASVPFESYGGIRIE